ncbi:MAG TPA: hypothetical protein VKW06_10595 [Candidatus Angelobacter sp.]|nr:hypothetical protein [Candidatus Angelobacter sp.]
MPTSPATPNGGVKAEGWEERKAPDLMQWNGVGDYVEGLLAEVCLVEITDKETNHKKRVMQYIVQEKDRTVKLLGSADINQKLSLKDQGSMVRITYTGNSKTVQKNNNPMREFQILVKPPGRVGTKFSDGTELTDEDMI